MKNTLLVLSLLYCIFTTLMLVNKKTIVFDLVDLRNYSDTTSVNDTFCMDSISFDTVYTYVEKALPNQTSWTGLQWTEKEKIDFVKYVNTQQRNLNEDQWVVIQVMLNICKAGGFTWTEYVNKYNHEGKFFSKCKQGLIWSYKYDPNSVRDKEILRRLNQALNGNIPKHLRIPENIIAFESHRDPNWNKHVKKGLWQRSMIGLTLDHEFYYDWSKVTSSERNSWKQHLKALEETYKSNKDG